MTFNINKNKAIVLALSIVILLVMVYVASQGQQHQQQNGNITIINQSQKNLTHNGSAAIANPASVYCVQHGGVSKIITASDGSQSGLCLFPDGSQCDEWAYYRGACSPLNPITGQAPVGNLSNQTQVPEWNTTGGGGMTTDEFIPSLIVNETINVTVNQTNITCSDTESLGENYSIAGTTSGTFNGIEGSYSDYCVGNALHFYMCKYLLAGPVISGTHTCPGICSNGACMNRTDDANCIDSDGGINLVILGSTSFGSVSTDYCINSSSVMEYYCLNNAVNGMAYDCPHGCLNGACTIPLNQTNISVLYESDFMVVDYTLPNLLTNQKPIEMPPPPG